MNFWLYIVLRGWDVLVALLEIDFLFPGNPNLNFEQFERLKDAFSLESPSLPYQVANKRGGGIGCVYSWILGIY